MKVSPDGPAHRHMSRGISEELLLICEHYSPQVKQLLRINSRVHLYTKVHEHVAAFSAFCLRYFVLPAHPLSGTHLMHLRRGMLELEFNDTTYVPYYFI